MKLDEALIEEEPKVRITIRSEELDRTSFTIEKGAVINWCYGELDLFLKSNLSDFDIPKLMKGFKELDPYRFEATETLSGWCPERQAHALIHSASRNTETSWRIHDSFYNPR